MNIAPYIYFLGLKGMNPQIPNEKWQHWLVKTFLLAAIYFKLLSRFDQGIMFWLIFPLGVVGLLWF